MEEQRDQVSGRGELMGWDFGTLGFAHPMVAAPLKLLPAGTLLSPKVAGLLSPCWWEDELGGGSVGW